MADNNLVSSLRNIATRLRIHSVESTTRAGSGHPSSCCSAADLTAVAFFAEMRFDPRSPHRPDADRFVLSKGHAAPLLYAAWAEAGAFDRAKLLTLRRFDSDLEGHPTPRLSFVDVATGSLGQGICAAVGMALNARRIGSDYRTYVLLGDGESAEGSVPEAATVAEFHHLDNLCAIIDINGLGQSRPTMFDHDLQAFSSRWQAFGWHTIELDGHDIPAVLKAFEEARQTRNRPTVLLARTIKGKGLSIMAGKEGWHGKALTEEQLPAALTELKAQFVDGASMDGPAPLAIRLPDGTLAPEPAPKPVAAPAYKIGDKVATREAYGTALAKLGDADARVVALDGDVANSTFSDKFEKAHPDRFYENFIAEQVMVGAAMGLASRGALPFPSTFAAFFTRAYDFIRMAAISNLNIKLAGSHCGVSIGEDGPSQMGLEDLAMMRAQPNFTVLYPCDGVSTERLMAVAAYHPGPAYIRTSRPKTPVIYTNDESFQPGGSKVLRESPDDVMTVVAAGVTVFEALNAYDVLSKSGVRIRVIDLYSVQPVDRATLVRCGRATRNTIVTVEDHYAGGGIGDAVADAVAADGIVVLRLAVREIPRSGKPEEMLEKFGVGAKQIVEICQSLVVSR
ncbi:MAG TPA: transketolase [Vicinamibacterales bacterium]|jgi:transketolase|nr:transketolase [Vicinamibacterales bacterium]